MTDILSKFNEQQVQNLKAGREFPNYSVGDNVKVSYRILEGDSSRIQIFEGVIIAKEKQKSNFSSSITVRKISQNIGVERKFLIHSPLVEKIEITKKGVVRRGKLYYLRKLKGKSARIREKIEGNTSSNK